MPTNESEAEILSVQERLDDAELLWNQGRRSGALLSVLVAVAALAKIAYPNRGDRQGFEHFMRTTHDWTISVEFRGKPTDLDHLFYKWMRCELVHDASLPVDIRIDDDFADPETMTVRAGGAPEHVVLLTPAWFAFLTDAARQRLDTQLDTGD